MKRLYAGLLVFMAFFTIPLFSMGGKIPNIPMKTYPVTDIKDGEFLHFGLYKGGEKVIDEYFVTVKEKNGSGGFYYRVYEDIISASGGRKLSANYTDWPVSVLIDPAFGSTIESEAKFSTNNLKAYAKFRRRGFDLFTLSILP